MLTVEDGAAPELTRLRRKFAPTAVSVFLVLLLAGCGGSANQTLARQGTINQSAPVQAEAQVVIDAPPAQVWNILVDIQDWPRWQPDITAVSIAQSPAIGVPFEWSTGSGRIHSRLALFEPKRRLAWTGRLLVFHAIHVWILMSLPNGRTLVRTRESMSGWPIGLFYSSNDLLAADRHWLFALKDRAESLQVRALH